MGFTRSLPVPFLLAALLAPVSAGAVDVSLGIQASTQAESNVFRTDAGSEADVSFRFRPVGAVSSDEGRFSYRAQYSPIFQVFIINDQVDQIAHILAADASYAISNKTAVSLTDRFRVSDTLNFFEPSGIGDSPQDDVERGQAYQNDVALSLRHLITSRWVSNSVGSHGFFITERQGAVDSQSAAFVQSFDYRHDGSNTYGFGFGGNWQQFDGVQTQPKSDSVTARVFATYIREIWESTSITLRGGPAYIQVFQVGESDDRLTFFAEVLAAHRWTENFDSALGYVRSDGGPSGLGSATISDRVTFETNYRPAERWDLGIRADWVRRESATNIVQTPPGSAPIVTDRGVDTSRWQVAGRAAYRISRNLTASLGLSYAFQNTKRSTTGPADFDNAVAILGIRYDFDPWHF